MTPNQHLNVQPSLNWMQSSLIHLSCLYDNKSKCTLRKSSIGFQLDRIVYNSGDCLSPGCPFKLCRTTKSPCCDVKTQNQQGLWHPYSVIAAQPRDTKHWEKLGVGVNDIQRIFCTNILRDYYCKANLSFSVSVLYFIYSRHSVTFKEYIFESDIRGLTPEGFISTLLA